MGNDFAARLRLRKRTKKLAKRQSTILDHEVLNEIEKKVPSLQTTNILPGGLRGSGEAIATSNHVTYPPNSQTQYCMSIGSAAIGGAPAQKAGSGSAARGSIGTLNALSGAVAKRGSTADRASIGGGSAKGSTNAVDSTRPLIQRGVSVGTSVTEPLMDIWQRPAEHQNPFSVSTYQINDSDQQTLVNVARSESESELRRRAWAMQRGSYMGQDGSHLSPIYRYPSAQPMDQLEHQRRLQLQQNQSAQKTGWSFGFLRNSNETREDRRASLGFARKSNSGEVSVPSNKRSRTKSPSPSGPDARDGPRQPLQARSAIVDEPRIRIREPRPAYIDEEVGAASDSRNRIPSKTQQLPSGIRAKGPTGPSTRSSLALDSFANSQPSPQPSQVRPALQPRSPLITSNSERRLSTTLTRDPINGNSLLRVDCNPISYVGERRPSSASFVLSVPAPTIPPPVDCSAAPSTGDEDSLVNHYDTQL